MLLDIWAWSWAHQKCPPPCQERPALSPPSPGHPWGTAEPRPGAQGGWLWAELGKGVQSCPSGMRGLLLRDTTRSQFWGPRRAGELLGHQHPLAPPNPHWGSCSPSWEVSSRGLVPPVGLEVQKRSSLGSVEAPGRSRVAPWAPSPVFVFEAASEDIRHQWPIIKGSQGKSRGRSPCPASGEQQVVP